MISSTFSSQFLVLATLAVLFAGAVHAQADGRLELGSAVRVRLSAGDDQCALGMLEVPADKLTDVDCKLRLSSFKESAATPRPFPTLDFFAATTKLEHIDSDNRVAETPCVAGATVIGVEYLDCDACAEAEFLNIDPQAFVGAVLVIDGVVEIDMRGKDQFKAAEVELAEGEYARFLLDAQESDVLHFDVDRCATCVTDDFELRWGPAGQSVANASTIDETNTVNGEFTAPANGDFVLFVRLERATAGGSSSFQLLYKRNEAPEDGDLDDDDDGGVTYADAAECGAGDNSASSACEEHDDDCAACAAMDGCKFCGTPGPLIDSGSCVDEAVDECAVGLEVIPAAECPKSSEIDEACEEIQTCSACAQTDGCLWCATIEGDVIDTGGCSAGRDNLGKECHTGVDPTAADECTMSSDVECDEFECRDCVATDGCAWCSSSLEDGSCVDEASCDLDVADQLVELDQCGALSDADPLHVGVFVVVSVFFFATLV